LAAQSTFTLRRRNCYEILHEWKELLTDSVILLVSVVTSSDASIGLKIASQKSVGYVVEAQKGLIPLIGLSKIQSTFLWFGDEYKPLSLAMSDSMLSTMRNSPKIRTEESQDDLYFGQIK
jgi:hypothetical protein